MKKIIVLLFLAAISTISCDDDIEINVGNEIQNQSNFQVEFDGETYYTEIAAAYIHNNITTIVAKKIQEQEYVVITLNETIEGSYILSPAESEGRILYKKMTDRSYITNATELSGRVDISTIDYTNRKLIGTFSFIGKRLTQQFDALGNPQLDGAGNLMFTEEVKTFTNGVFNNLVLSLAEPENIEGEPETNTNEFFVNIDTTDNATDDGTEYEEQIVTAKKITEGGNTYVVIKAKRNGMETITLKIPIAMPTGNRSIKDVIVTGNEVVGDYTLDQNNYYLASNQVAELLNLRSHDLAAKKMEGEFDFDVIHSVTGEVVHFYGGTFKVTYTD